MIDLHCHILPGIDDGAKNTDVSLELLEEEKKQGVRAIAFTPHFHSSRISLEGFLRAREHSFNKLMEVPGVKEMDISFRYGAEVFFSTKLNELELDQLCLNDTNYILIELPTNEKPYGLTQTLVEIINRGYCPILAHVERYPYFTAEPTMLYKLIEKGCIAQINGGAILEGEKIALKYIKWGMAQIICSDAHNMKNRQPNLKAAFRVVEKKFGDDYVRWFKKNARDIFKGRYVDQPMPKEPKKVLGFWI